MGAGGSLEAGAAGGAVASGVGGARSRSSIAKTQSRTARLALAAGSRASTAVDGSTPPDAASRAASLTDGVWVCCCCSIPFEASAEERCWLRCLFSSPGVSFSRCGWVGRMATQRPSRCSVPTPAASTRRHSSSSRVVSDITPENRSELMMPGYIRNEESQLYPSTMFICSMQICDRYI